MKKISVASAAMGAVITGALAVSVKNAADAQKSQKQLEHATLNVAKAGREQLKMLEDTAAALQKKGVLDGDNIKMGQAQLMTFGISAQMANKLSGSLADLAVNQFGVRASGDDLTNTANMIAKALNGQFGVLEKSGIRFTEAQRQMIQFGNETERTSALQEGLAQNLKFTNEVALQTFDGQLAKLQSTIGDVTEEIGMVLIPILTDLVKTLQPVIENVILWMQQHPELTQYLVVITAAVGALMLALGTLWPVLAGISSALGILKLAFSGAALVMGSPFLVPVAAVVAALTGVILILKNLAGGWQELELVVEIVNQNIRTSVAAMVEWVTGKLQTLMDFFELIAVKASGLKDYTRSDTAGGRAVQAANRGAKRAMGGTVGNNEPFTLVGEKGAEIVSLPAGSRVTPAHQSAQMRGGLNLSIIVQGSVIGLSPDELVQRLGGSIMRQLNSTIAHA